MEKKLYFKFSDNAAVQELIMPLSQCMSWIEADAGVLSEFFFSQNVYTITPVYMTEEEFNNLPEADIF